MPTSHARQREQLQSLSDTLKDCRDKMSFVIFSRDTAPARVRLKALEDIYFLEIELKVYIESTSPSNQAGIDKLERQIMPLHDICTVLNSLSF